jgi:DNA modification methylase
MKPYYADDLVTLYHGDCRDLTAWLSADVMVSDPPYGIGWKKSLNRAAGSRAHDGIQGDADTSVRDAALALWGERPAAVFGSFYAPFPASVRHVLVWQKPNDAGIVGSTTGWRRDVEPVFLLGTWPKRSPEWSSVIRSHARMIGGANGTAGRVGHPHAKPVDLLWNLIAFAPAGVVADPFAGSGSTLIAAKTDGRRAIGVEIDENYCEIAAERCRQQTMHFGGAA